MKKKKKDELKARILAFMLYKDYIGDKTLPLEKLEEEMEKAGWLTMPPEKIAALFKRKKNKKNRK